MPHRYENKTCDNISWFQSLWVKIEFNIIFWKLEHGFTLQFPGQRVTSTKGWKLRKKQFIDYLSQTSQIDYTGGIKLYLDLVEYACVGLKKHGYKEQDAREIICYQMKQIMQGKQ